MPRSGGSGSLSQIARELTPSWNGLRLLLFPAAEFFCIMAAVRSVTVSLWATAGFIAVAAVALAYSLHITFHEVVHRRFFRHPVTKWLSESAITALLGTPFNEYRQSHWRHHRHTNLLEDSTSTWKATPQGPKPRNFLAYALGWPSMGPRSFRQLLLELRETHHNREILRHVIAELVLIGLIHAALLLYDPALWLIYSAVIYLGWTCIATVNYLQHPPVEYGSGYTTSLYSPTYNLMFYNNGLHFEHHARVQEPVISLSPTPGDWRVYRSRQNRPDGPKLTGRSGKETNAAVRGQERALRCGNGSAG